MTACKFVALLQYSWTNCPAHALVWAHLLLCHCSSSRYDSSRLVLMQILHLRTFLIVFLGVVFFQRCSSICFSYTLYRLLFFWQFAAAAYVLPELSRSEARQLLLWLNVRVVSAYLWVAISGYDLRECLAKSALEAPLRREGKEPLATTVDSCWKTTTPRSRLR
jgi:hypothetical protein